MDKAFSQATETHCDELSKKIEATIPAARITNMGWLVLVVLPNHSVFTVAPLTSATCDVSGTDSQDQRHECENLSWEQALGFLQMVSGERIEEETERDQTGRKKVSPLGFPDDPLGSDRSETRPNKNSEGRRASRIGHNFEGGSPLALSEQSGSAHPSQMYSYLSEMLPVDSADVEGNKLALESHGVSIVVTGQADGNFSIQSSIDGEVIQQSENVSAGDLIRWLFFISDAIQKRAEQNQPSEPVEDVAVNDAYSVLKELAEETGKATDPIRNKSLFDLRQGLVMAKPPFDQRSGRRFFGQDFAPGHTPDPEVSASVRGDTTHNGHPVSLNENRDASRPYANTLGGMKLVYVQGEGAVLVDAAQIPPSKKLAWDAKHGVILTDENLPSNRKDMWFFRGWN
jgi:hypothetical protein